MIQNAPPVSGLDHSMIWLTSSPKKISFLLLQGGDDLVQAEETMGFSSLAYPWKEIEQDRVPVKRNVTAGPGAATPLEVHQHSLPVH